jgi:hypothetical protein
MAVLSSLAIDCVEKLTAGAITAQLADLISLKRFLEVPPL